MASREEREIEELNAQAAAEEAERMRRDSLGTLAGPEMVGRFERHKLPDGSVVYKEHRGDNHYYHAEVKESRSAEGGYSYVKGSTLTGVSTASKYLDGDPGGLMHWSARLNMAGVARIASSDMEAGASLGWLRSPESIEARLRDEEATWEHERDRRADQGTNVHHESVWKLASGQEATLANVSDAERGFSRGVFTSFRDLGLLGKVTHAEQVTVAFDKQVGGTFDLLAEDVEVDRLLARVVNGSAVPPEIAKRDTIRLLADYKTRDGIGKVRKSDYLQLQGYEDCNCSCGIGGSDGQVVIIVLPDGTFEVYWCEATYGQWVAARNSCFSAKPLDSRIRKMKEAAKTARDTAEQTAEMVA